MIRYQKLMNGLINKLMNTECVCVVGGGGGGGDFWLVFVNKVVNAFINQQTRNKNSQISTVEVLFPSSSTNMGEAVEGGEGEGGGGGGRGGGGGEGGYPTTPPSAFSAVKPGDWMETKHNAGIERSYNGYESVSHKGCGILNGPRLGI